MLIFRYLAREVYITLTALTGVLLLIFLSNQMVRYVGRAASGRIPTAFVLKLLALEIPMLAGLLLPLGFYIALLLAYGRLYADSEMTALHASGFGQPRLLKHSLAMAAVVSSIVLIVLLWVNPIISLERKKLLRSEGVQVMIKTLVPERFSSLPRSQDVIYVEKMHHKNKQAEGIFLAHHRPEQNQWEVIWADSAEINAEPKSSAMDLVLHQGKAYQGLPGHADYRVVQFDKYQTALPEPVVVSKVGDLRAMKTKDLFPIEGDKAKIAEIQWRFLLPLMPVILTPIAVTLSRVNPRMGKYAKLLPAVLIFILYADLMFVVRDAIASGKIPWWLGSFGLHGSMIMIGLGLLWRSQTRFA